MTKSQTLELATLAANLAESKKAKDVTVLETKNVSTLADYFVICTGESTTQIRAITEEISKEMKKLNHFPMGEERDKGSRWHLIDYGELVIHIFHPQERQFYQIEGFWNHANKVSREKWSSNTKALKAS